MKINGTLDELIKTLNNQMFMKSLQEKGNVFLVGGIVRDSFLNKKSKDIDLLVTGITTVALELMLNPYGNVDRVGQSFGVLKFVPSGMKLDEPIDIAIPRTENSTGIGHKDFDVIASHDIPVEMDLKRRDFTINAIALNLNGQIIDPFNGLDDLEKKLIRMVNPIAFTDDPLRMLRAIQFASRFEFSIEKNTFEAINEKAETIKHITSERILIELEKIQTKGNIKNGIMLLTESGLFKHIFGFESDFSNVSFNDIKIRADFFFTLLKDTEIKHEAFKTILKGDIDTADTIKAIQLGFENVTDNIVTNRNVAFMMNKISEQSLDSGILPDNLKVVMQELKSGKFPLTMKNLAVNGNDIIDLGFKGIEIGRILNFALLNVFSERIQNKKEDIINLIKNENFENNQ